MASKGTLRLQSGRSEWSMLCDVRWGILEPAFIRGLGKRRELRDRHARLGENVDHFVSLCQKIVRYYAPVTTPPDSFGAYDGRRVAFGEAPQSRQPGSEIFGQSVIGVVAKAFVAPAFVGRRPCRLTSSQSAQFLDVLIADLKSRKAVHQCLDVELRVASRSGHGSDVDDEVRSCCTQQFSKFLDRSGRMSDREDAMVHFTCPTSNVLARSGFLSIVREESGAGFADVGHVCCSYRSQGCMGVVHLDRAHHDLGFPPPIRRPTAIRRWTEE